MLDPKPKALKIGRTVLKSAILQINFECQKWDWRFSSKKAHNTRPNHHQRLE
jgi:hypothetical protein